MLYYKVIHKYRLDNHNEIKGIGIFSSQAKALEAIDKVKLKAGFVDHQDGFIIKKSFRLFKPRLLNNIYWIDGFVTYYS